MSPVTNEMKRVQGAAIAHGAEHIGDVLMYDAESLKVARTALKAAFTAEGLGELVAETMTPVAALGRAQSRPMPRTMRVATFARPNNDTAHAIGIYVKMERPGEGGDLWPCGARVRVEAGRIVALAPEGHDAIPEAMEIARAIADDASELLTFAETTDVTAAAIAAITGPYMGVAMRKRGGAYFVRPAEGQRWQRLAARLAPYGFVDLSYPMAGDNRSAAAASHVAKGALETDLAALRAEVEAFDDKTRTSTMEKRIDAADTLLAKADLYADLLGDWVARLRRDTDKVKVAVQRKLDKDADDFTFGRAANGD